MSRRNPQEAKHDEKTYLDDRPGGLSRIRVDRLRTVIGADDSDDRDTYLQVMIGQPVLIPLSQSDRTFAYRIACAFVPIVPAATDNASMPEIPVIPIDATLLHE